MARMTKNSMKPMIMWTKMTDGPARLMVLPDPMNSPVPMAPPMAISWMWRLDNERERCGSGDVRELVWLAAGANVSSDMGLLSGGRAGLNGPSWRRPS